MKRILLIFCLIPACSDAPQQNDKTADAAPPQVDSSPPEPDAPPAPLTCLSYPLSYTPSPTAEADFTTALSAISSHSSISWSDPRGTPKYVIGMDIPLSCADSDNLYEKLEDVVTANPDVFKMNTSEWDFSSNAPCSIVNSSSSRTLTIGRKTIGTQDVRRDTVALISRRNAGGVYLSAMTGTYLPTFSDDLNQDLEGCADLDMTVAETNAVAASHNYATFYQCQATGTGSYAMQPGDTLSLAGPPAWSWHETATGIELTKTQDVHLVIPESNHTPELLSSTANCPDPNSNDRLVGFVLRYDAVTGQLLSSTAGIGCIVC